MTARNVFEKLDNEEKRRYVADHAPNILCALIVRRASTNPSELVDLAVETAVLLFDKLESNRRSSNGLTNGHAAEEARPN